MKSGNVSWCFVGKHYKPSDQFRDDAEIQSCLKCAKNEHDRLSVKGILNLRTDESKALVDYNKTIQVLEGDAQ